MFGGQAEGRVWKPLLCVGVLGKDEPCPEYAPVACGTRGSVTRALTHQFTAERSNASCFLECPGKEKIQLCARPLARIQASISQDTSLSASVFSKDTDFNKSIDNWKKRMYFNTLKIILCKVNGPLETKALACGFGQCHGVYPSMAGSICGTRSLDARLGGTGTGSMCKTR